ncbi:glycosyltransferase family 2 protein [Arthrobacter sp. 08Y14]|uniref:glycosyltransferase family 2 protein n=1 Tax=Arthrobacter sp. 08Y14 TaxID=2058885 RepID=UPI000CE2D5B8|nr:glycosyltransferase family 2 protein [Arthrobacter sp. 08Y14]
MPAQDPVAVIVRTKNRPHFLQRALQDIFDQTYRQFRVVIVNDGGSAEPVDNVVARLPEAARERVEILHNKQSLGMEAASNSGVQSCDSEYIVIHDDDDLWHPEFLERTVSYLDNSSDAGVVVRTQIRYEEIVDGQILKTGSAPFWENMQQISLGDMLQINRAVPISFLYRRSLHEELGYFNESLPVCGDWEFNLRVLTRHRIGFLDGEPLAFWCQRPATGGDDANSLFAKARDHERFDRSIRDEYLRRDLSSGRDLGVLLQISAMMAEQEQMLMENRQRMVQMQEQLTDATQRLEHIMMQRTSFLARAGTAAAKIKGALKGVRRR